jgi:hypothetical protein
MKTMKTTTMTTTTKVDPATRIAPIVQVGSADFIDRSLSAVLRSDDLSSISLRVLRSDDSLSISRSGVERTRDYNPCSNTFSWENSTTACLVPSKGVMA